MRYQIRLLDQNLPGFTRELALAAWHAVDALIPEPPGDALYRAIFRGFRTVFRSRVEAFRFCGATGDCEHSLQPKALVKSFPHERRAGERIRVYLTGPESPPEKILNELVAKAVKATAQRFPKRHLPGLARGLRNVLEKGLHGKLFESRACGESPLCPMNEAIDPWDLREPANRVLRA
jgi:hypothetical protein